MGFFCRENSVFERKSCFPPDHLCHDYISYFLSHRTCVIVAPLELEIACCLHAVLILYEKAQLSEKDHQLCSLWDVYLIGSCRLPQQKSQGGLKRKISSKELSLLDMYSVVVFTVSKLSYSS